MNSYFASLHIVSEIEVSSFRNFMEVLPTSEEVSLTVGSNFEAYSKKKSYSHYQLHISEIEDGWIYESANGAIQLQVSKEYGKLTAYFTADEFSADQEQKLVHLLKAALECRLLFMGTISLHAACVQVGGRAFAFTAASGTGKSTRATAWERALGAEWVSGDRPAIRMGESGATACGVPWDGKEQIFRQVEYPLFGICEVRRAPFEKIRRLSTEQARNVLMHQCFIPMWDVNAAFAAMTVIRRMIENVPIYRMFCGPDEKAAQRVYEILMNSPEDIKEELPDMKIKEGFVLRNVVGEYVVMPTGEQIDAFGGSVVLNETGAFLWEKLKQSVSREDLLHYLTSEYEVEEEIAACDLDALLVQLREYDLLVEE